MPKITSAGASKEGCLKVIIGSTPLKDLTVSRAGSPVGSTAHKTIAIAAEMDGSKITKIGIHCIAEKGVTTANSRPQTWIRIAIIKRIHLDITHVGVPCHGANGEHFAII